MERIDVGQKTIDKVQVHKGLTNKFVFKQDNKVYFFKENEKTSMDLGNDIAEVLSVYFFKKVGYKNFVNYELAQDGNSAIGVICESFISDDVICEKNFAELMTLYLYQQKYGKKYDITSKFTEKQLEKVEHGLDAIIRGENYNSIEFAIDIVKRVCKSCGVAFDEHKVEKDLLKMSILDFFMSDCDRHSYNLEFLFKKNGDKIYCELTPSFDHGCAFGIRNYWLDISKGMLPNIASYYYPAIGISKHSQIYRVENDEIVEDGGLFVRELMQKIEKDRELSDLFKRCREVDIQECIKDFNEKESAKISEMLAEHIIQTYNQRLSMVETQEREMKKAGNIKNKKEGKDKIE